MTQEERRYLEAKKDIMKAEESIRKLTPQQQEQLAREFLEIKGAQHIYQMLKQFLF